MHKYKSSLILVLLLVFTVMLNAQKETPPPGYENLPKLTAYDSIGLVNLPELTLPDWLKGPNKLNLPDVVDNSEQIYWRPVFAQVQYECGQASGVGLGFTYAINRLRNLPSNVEDNQYPSHFTWNFGNGGDGWYGVSYFHSFEIIKREGNPNVIDFGGMTGTGPEMWMSGYDKYYNAMHNRIADVYKIDLTTEEGINTLRNWIHNHLEGSEVGGVANFYTNAPYGMPTLPEGTPEEGMFVVTGWGGANHGLTISGYHDSICWDYNNDGFYTNDIDLNNDGIITPQDWEVGGFRFANTYSGGPSFGNDGFCYMTYKSCADPYGDGGIWDNAAHVLYAKEGTEPLLTAKVYMHHNCRDRIGIKMGMTTDLSSETPDFVMGFPIFDYQGGCQYMQGGSTNPDHKFIEFGLDITPFLNMIEPGTPARFFLLIDEDDPESWAGGQMMTFSVIDYTNGVEEVVCDQNTVTLIDNDVTKFWVDHTVNFESVEISNDTLAPATVYEPYSEQLEADGGTEPYTWVYDKNFTESFTTTSFPLVNAELITPGNTNDGYTTKDLDFAFPFYDEEFDYVRVNVDGFISFENMFSWPYQVYDFFHFTKNKLISPFHTDLRIYSSTNDGMWYEGDENSATFRWKASINGYENTSEVNFAVQLFSNGDIIFYYGAVNDYPEIDWVSGLSSGDNIYYQFTEVTNDASIAPNLAINLESAHQPEGLFVSRYGDFHGTVTQTYDNFDVKFLVTDENNLTSSREMSFSTDGSNYLVIKSVEVNSGDDEIIEFGETAVLSIEVESLGEETIYGADMLITNSDMYVTLVDSTETLGDFEPGEVKSFDAAFTITVDNAVPDDHEIDLPTLITDNTGDDWVSHIYLTAFAPDIYISNVTIDDGGNGGLDPGETADMIVSLFNSGGARASNIEALLSSTDPYITINSASYNLDELHAGTFGDVVFNITCSDETPPAYIAEFDVEIEADNDYYTTDQAYVICGLITEGFESGNFETFPWTFSGDAEWEIDDVEFFEGSYSARSGDIDDDKLSSMEFEAYVLGDGEISFYRKVSSEANYDYLRFYINGVLMDEWAGDVSWSEVSFNITSGINTFKWAYEKDYSVSNGEDCAWVDNISLPPVGDMDPQIIYTPETFLVIVEDNILAQDTLTISNTGTGLFMYTIDIVDTAGNVVDWLTVDDYNGGLNAGDENEILVFFDGTNLVEGLYKAEIIITDHISNEYIVPAWFYIDLTIGIDENKLISGSMNIPNPFERETNIQFTISDLSEVNIDVFNSHGEIVKRLVQSQLFKRGGYSISWDATNDIGGKVNSGLYYYRILAGEETVTGKMILLD